MRISRKNWVDRKSGIDLFKILFFSTCLILVLMRNIFENFFPKWKREFWEKIIKKTKIFTPPTKGKGVIISFPNYFFKEITPGEKTIFAIEKGKYYPFRRFLSPRRWAGVRSAPRL
jgi:hypothetical protein